MNGQVNWGDVTRDTAAGFVGGAVGSFLEPAGVSMARQAVAGAIAGASKSLTQQEIDGCFSLAKTLADAAKGAATRASHHYP